MLMSTAFHEAKPTPLHCQLPLAGVQPGTWQNLLLDMAGLTQACFKGSTFQAVDLVCLSSAFKVCFFETRLSVCRCLSLGSVAHTPCQHWSCMQSALRGAKQLRKFVQTQHVGQVPRCCCRFGAFSL